MLQGRRGGFRQREGKGSPARGEERGFAGERGEFASPPAGDGFAGEGGEKEEKEKKWVF